MCGRQIVSNLVTFTLAHMYKCTHIIIHVYNNTLKNHTKLNVVATAWQGSLKMSIGKCFSLHCKIKTSSVPEGAPPDPCIWDLLQVETAFQNFWICHCSYNTCCVTGFLRCLPYTANTYNFYMYIYIYSQKILRV